MPRTRFTLANLTGGATWSTATAVGGYAAGVSYRALEHRLGLGGEAILAAIVIAVLVWLLRRRRARPVPADRNRSTA